MFVNVRSKVVTETAKVPAKISFITEGCSRTDLGWTSIFYFILTHYQSMIILVLACLTCVYLTKFVIQNTTSKLIGGPPPGATAQNSSGSKPNLVGTPMQQQNNSQSPSFLNADNKPYLWTADTSPIYGSPNYSNRRRSPRQLTQYSYSDM